MKKAQAELDRVIKAGHLPEIDDRSSLPYVTAIAKETLRWREVAPIGNCRISCPYIRFTHGSLSGVPHFLKVEDEYRGYRLPAGSVIIGSP
jgi:cytochrome P450